MSKTMVMAYAYSDAGGGVEEADDGSRCYDGGGQCLLQFSFFFPVQRHQPLVFSFSRLLLFYVPFFFSLFCLSLKTYVCLPKISSLPLLFQPLLSVVSSLFFLFLLCSPCFLFLLSPSFFLPSALASWWCCCSRWFTVVASPLQTKMMLGIPTGDVLIFAHRRLKHTDTIFNVVRQNRLHPRERVHII